MAISRQAKVDLQKDLGEKLDKASAVFVSEYRGLSVEQLSKLRVELNKADSEYKICKNRIFKRAIEDGKDKYASLVEHLKGPNGFVYVYGDSAQAAKSVVEFEKEHDDFKIKGAILDGESVTQDQLKAIADLPSREVLLGQVVGSIVAPHRGLVTTVSGLARNLVQVINAIKDQKN